MVERTAITEMELLQVIIDSELKVNSTRTKVKEAMASVMVKSCNRKFFTRLTLATKDDKIMKRL